MRKPIVVVPYVPGSQWRLRANGGERVVQYQNEGVFDELVVDHWLHIEQMSRNEWWMQLGEAHLWVTVDGLGRAARASVTEGVEIHDSGLVRLACGRGGR